MGFKRFVKAAVKTAVPAYGINENVLGQKGREQAGADIAQGYSEGKQAISSAYPKAQAQLQAGMQSAEDEARRGYGQARSDYSGGMESARGRITAGQTAAEGNIRSGYGAARDIYEKDPGIVSSRQEIYDRVLGKGGYSPETLNAMKASSREEYGTAARDLGMGLNTMMGGAGAQGLAAENYAMGMQELGAKRARDVRDIDVQNAMLQEQQQTDAIKSSYEDAALRAGLSTDEAKYLAEINTGASKDLAAIDQNEAMGLSNLSQQEAQMVEQIREKLAVGGAQLTTEEAQLLAQLAAGGGAAMASTRDTEGLMPLISGGVQGAAAAQGRG